MFRPVVRVPIARFWPECLLCKGRRVVVVLLLAVLLSLSVVLGMPLR